MNAVVSCFDSGACLAQLGAAEKNIERIEEIRDRLQEYESWWLFLQRSPWTEVGKLGSSFNIDDGWSLLRGELGAIPDATIHVCKDFTESYWAFYTASYPSDDLLGRIHIHLRKAKEAGVGVECLGDISANEDRLEY
ncbi:MAG: hypothetical protein KF886_26360 [Candidatus Hydrogenedentes bacterium]|nr:hypothetical protein [Candidatus Hydrogenedentota bacterium]